MKIKAAIFDVDGTILDTMPIWRIAMPNYLKEHGFNPKTNITKHLFKMSIREGAEFIIKEYGIKKTVNEIEEDILKFVRNFYFYKAQSKPGVINFIKKLYDKQIPMILATSGNRELVTRGLERVGVLKYFQDVYTTTEHNTNKNEPDIYVKAAEMMKAKPEETVVFEDALYAVKTAKEAGFVCVGIEEDTAIDDREKIKDIADYYTVSYDNLDEILD